MTSIIGVIGALPEEIQPLIVKHEEVVECGGNKYYIINNKNKRIVIAQCKVGKVNAAMTASAMVLHFQCTLVIFSGVAGALNDQLQIGDLLVATKLCQHDIDCTQNGFQPGCVPESEQFIQGDIKMIEAARVAASQLNIKLFEGVVATGDQFVSDSKRKKWVKDTFKADAIEMEGASVAHVCQQYKVLSLIIRSISDTAEDGANANYNEYLKSSAERSAQLVQQIIDNS